jgi:hypothetical protein
LADTAAKLQAGNLTVSGGLTANGIMSGQIYLALLNKFNL